MPPVLIVPPNELDPVSAPRFAAMLESVEPTDHVEVDFESVRFCDSSGLRQLLIAHRRQQAGGGSLRVVNVPSNVQRVFDVSGVSEVMAHGTDDQG